MIRRRLDGQEHGLRATGVRSGQFTNNCLFRFSMMTCNNNDVPHALVVWMAVQLGLAVLISPASAARPNSTRLPGGVPDWSGENVNHHRPPPGFSAGVMWLQAVHDTSGSGQGTVEVDWIRLHAVVGDKDVIVARDEYNDRKVCGGLFTRYPWFGSNRHGRLPADFDTDGGYLVLRPSQAKDKVYHWWNCSRGQLPAGTQSSWAEARLRIHGPTAVQAGIDYWKDVDIGYGGTEVNNKEGSSSRWLFAAPQWQTLTVPRRPAGELGSNEGRHH